MRSLTLSHRQPTTRTTPHPSTASWRWLYATDNGVAIEGPAVRFATEASAQHFLGSNAEALLQQRITWVTLLDGEHVVVGPLSLR